MHHQVCIEKLKIADNMSFSACVKVLALSLQLLASSELIRLKCVQHVFSLVLPQVTLWSLFAED